MDTDKPGSGGGKVVSYPVMFPSFVKRKMNSRDDGRLQ